VSRGSLSLGLTLGHLLVGARLLVPALAVAFTDAGRQAFARHGLGDGPRLLLSGAEIVAALLFMFPATAGVGAPLLLLVLTGAAGLHVAVGQRAWGLAPWAASVLGLWWARTRFARRAGRDA